MYDLNIFAPGIIANSLVNFLAICFVEKIKSIHLQSVRNSGLFCGDFFNIKKHKSRCSSAG